MVSSVDIDRGNIKNGKCARWNREKKSEYIENIHNNDELTKRVNELKCKLEEGIGKGCIDGCITELNYILVTAGAGHVNEFKESNEYANNLNKKLNTPWNDNDCK